jgi:hypothetical protein
MKSRNAPVALLLAAFLLALFLNRILFLPKLLAFLGIVIIAAAFDKLKALRDDWFAFLAFAYLSDSLRGVIYLLTCRLGLPVYTLYALRAERALFGQIPSVALQKTLLPDPTGASFAWLEKILTGVHASHFVAFLLLGLFIWLRRSELFDLYKTSFYILISVGLLIYALVPTVPPWMAAELFSLLPKLVHFNVIIYNIAMPGLTTGFNTNPIGAMPSLHAAFPVLASLLLWKWIRWKGWPFYLYTLAVFFMIVYTGDHYIVDILAGIALAVASYAAAGKLVARRTSRLQRFINKPAEGHPKPPLFSRKVRALSLGGSFLALGIGLGLFCDGQFARHPEAYDYGSASYYADFFRHEADFGDNFGVQFYLGKHCLARHDDERALMFLQNALALSRSFMEKKSVEQRIRQCRTRLGQAL